MFLELSKKIKHYRLQTILFWLLLTSGALKSIFIYHNSSFDLTLFVFVLVFFDILFSIGINYKKIRLSSNQIIYALILVFFYFLFFTSLLYTPSENYSYEKIYLFLPCILSFFYGLFIFKIDVKLLYNLYAFLFLPSAIWFLIGRNTYYTSLRSLGIFNESFLLITTNYLNFGIGVSIMILLHIHLKKSNFQALFLFVILLGLGSRGALLFLVLLVLFWKLKAIGAFVLYNFRIAKRKIPLLLSGLFITSIGAVFLGDKIIELVSIGIYRFQSLLEFSKDKPSQERIDMLGFALNDIFGSVKTFFIGNGIGSYGLLYNGIDQREYPHNIFIEAWFELGLVGMLLLMLFLLYPFVFFKNRKQHIFLIIYIFLFLNTMKTGDLVSIWTLYALGGLLIFKVDAKT